MKDNNLTPSQKVIVDAIASSGTGTRQTLQTNLQRLSHSTIDTGLKELKDKEIITADKQKETRNQLNGDHQVSVNVYRISG